MLQIQIVLTANKQIWSISYFIRKWYWNSKQI